MSDSSKQQCKCERRDESEYVQKECKSVNYITVKLHIQKREGLILFLFPGEPKDKICYNDQVANKCSCSNKNIGTCWNDKRLNCLT